MPDDGSLEAGRVVAIFTAPEKGAPIVAHDAVRAIAGRGLEGDRGAGAERAPGDQLTFVAQEAIDSLRRHHDVDLPDGFTRRNVVTEGIDLHELVGVTFRVGEVEVRGEEPCHPCRNLELLTDVPGMPASDEGWGGLRASIVRGGTLRVGDRVVPSS